MAEVEVIKNKKVSEGPKVGQYWRNAKLEEVYILMEFELYEGEELNQIPLYALCGLSDGYPYSALSADIDAVFSDDEDYFELLDGCSLNIKID